MRNINHIQKAQQIPSRVDPKRSIPNTLYANIYYTLIRNYFI